VSATSENIIIRHSQKQHPDLQPCPKPNPDADKFVFDEEFWDRFYGIHKTREGVKMRSEFVPEVDQPAIESNHDCQYCPFKTAHSSALKRHIVSHKFTYGYVVTPKIIDGKIISLILSIVRKVDFEYREFHLNRLQQVKDFR
jgi:hypothetical protein